MSLRLLVCDSNQSHNPIMESQHVSVNRGYSGSVSLFRDKRPCVRIGALNCIGAVVPSPNAMPFCTFSLMSINLCQTRQNDINRSDGPTSISNGLSLHASKSPFHNLRDFKCSFPLLSVHLISLLPLSSSLKTNMTQ